MNRKEFLSRLGLGILAVPFLSKLIPEKKLVPLPRTHLKSTSYNPYKTDPSYWEIRDIKTGRLLDITYANRD